MTTFGIRPVGGSIGAEVDGVDLADLTDQAWQQIHALWLEHLVFFFRDQTSHSR